MSALPATVVYQPHVLAPTMRRVELVPERATIWDLNPGWGRPYIALIDGTPVLRAQWHTVVLRGQVLTFVDVESLPAGGGGGSNPVRLIAMLAVMAIAIGVPFLAPAGSMIAAGTFGGSLFSAGVMMVGSALVNALLPATTAQSSVSAASASPTYSLAAQGNTARIEQAIPEHFGRCIAFPDFAAQPYQEFSGNDQYLYQLLCVGRGEYSIEAIRIDDTDLSSFDDISTEVVPPYNQVTLFPSQVATSAEVSTQALEYNTAVGPFTANEPETVANYIGVDFVCPKGLFYATDDGGLSTMSVTVLVEAREIDDFGVPAGDWSTLGTHVYSGATATPQRYSQKYPVSKGRYEVRATRTTVLNESSRAGHDITWAGLRAYLVDDNVFGDMTLIALRMRASDQLTSLSSRKVNVICTRCLPIYDGETWSAANVPTRSIAWAAAYACKQVGLTDSEIDLASLLALDSTWAGRGDTCDGRIDATETFWSAVTKILIAGRAKPFMQAGVMRFFRDQAATLPVAVFSMRNIVKNSLTVEYIMPSADTADCVTVTYFDETVWAQRRVRAALLSSTTATPAKISLDLVVNRDQAHREGLYQAGSNRFRRKMITFTTEMEGSIPSFGDLIVVQHDMPAWGQGGEVLGWDAAALTVTTSEPLEWMQGEAHYIVLRRADGSAAGPYACTQGADEYHVVLTAIDADFMPYCGRDMERTHYSFGWAATWGQPARVLSVTPRSLLRYEIQAVAESDNVHTADQGVETPATTSSGLGNYSVAPALDGLLCYAHPDDPDTMLLSWKASPWADSYLIDVSADGENWTRVGNTTATQYACLALYGGATIVRVAAVGAARGPWVTVAYGGVASYMWNSDASTLMWGTDDTVYMWKR